MTEETANLLATVQDGTVPAGYTKVWHLMPEDWKDVPLSHIFKKKSQKNKGNNVKTVFTNSAVNGIIPQSDYFEKDIANTENTEGYSVVDPLDYVYNPRISENAPYGPFKRNDTGLTGIVSPLYTVLTPRKEFAKSEFLHYYLESAQWHKYAYSIANYGARFDRMNITDDELMRLPIAWPSLPEQDRIAEILMQCDKVVRLKQERIEEEKKKKKWLFNKLLVIPHKAQRLGAVCTVGDVAEVVGRIGFRGYTKEDLVSAGEGAMSMSPSNMNDGEIDFSFGSYISWKKYNESPEIMLQKDDILFVKTGSTYGKCAQARVLSEPATINPQLAIIRAINVSPDYLSKVLESDIVQRRVKQIVVGGAVPTLTQEEIHNFEISIPSPAEQHKISVILLQQDNLIKKLKEEVHRLQSKKKALMQLLLTGIVRTKA